MKRHVLVVVLAVIMVSAGLQAAPSRADTYLDRGNAMLGEALPEELKALDVKDYYVASGAAPVGLIQTVTGHVVVLHGDTGEAYFAAADDAICQQDALFTLEGSRCRIKFSTEDVVTMGEDTRIEIEEFVDDHELQKKKSTFRMLKGKAMFYVIPLFRYKHISTTVKTQTAVMGVRGTKFGVEVTFLDLAQATETSVYGFEGEVEVYSHVDGTTLMVGEGENLRVSSLGAGNVQDMDIGMAEQFMSDTEAPAPEGEEIGADDEGVEVQAEPADEEEAADFPVAAESDDSATIPTDMGDFTDVTQDQTTTTLDVWETWEGKTAGEGGYFTTIIANAADGIAYNSNSPIKDPIYISHFPNLFSGGLETHIAYAVDHEDDPSYMMKIEEIDPNMTMKVTYFRWGHTCDIALTVGTHLFEWHEGGSFLDENGQDYLQWGWWEDTETTDTGQIGHDSSTSPPDDNFFAATARIWEVEGDFTHSDAISFLQQQNFSATYTGEAKGVYASSDTMAPADVSTLTGSFSCHIDFGNSHVSNFDINVNDGSGGHQVHISGGSGTLGSCGSFEISGFTGTIDGAAIASDPDTGAIGACFGGKAQGVGGLWGAHDEGEKWATGEFHGKR